jgi:hypothetical protein
MSSPSSRQNLIDYCLRKLGHPVLEINIDDDQLEDRIDEAFQFYREFHYDAVELVYLKTQVTPSLIQITGVNAASFTNSELITGSSSGATAIVYSNVSANRFNVYQVTGTFTATETLTGNRSGTTATLSTITLGSYDNKYFAISDAVTGVNKVLQLSNTSNSNGMFDVRYQLMLNNIQSLTNTDIIYYTQLKTHLNLINDLMTGQKPMQYNRHMNRLYVDMDWGSDVLINNYIMVECYRILDPDTYTDVYNDYFLKRYATALIKQQWGINMKKFEGVQLPGGVTLNGQKIYDEATEELQQLRDEAEKTFQLPVDFFTG